MPTTATANPSSNEAAIGRVHRFEVAPAPGQPDPIGERVRRDGAAIGIGASGVRVSHVYLVQGELKPDQQQLVASALLADPITEVAHIGSSSPGPGAQVIEVHSLPGVMDPVAQSVAAAISDLTGTGVEVSTAWRYDIAGISAAEAQKLGRRLLANPVIQRVFSEPHHPTSFPHGQSHEHPVRSVPLLNLSEADLSKLSREAHLFLSPEEMTAIQTHFRSIGRDPTDVELETLAQTWSEHCVHKTLKSRVRYTQTPAAGTTAINWAGRPGHRLEPDGSVTIENLLKSTVAAATFELIADGVDWTLSVFKDNSGVVAFDDDHGLCIKVETHNRPSAIEPYGGAATGAGGCIRDVIGTGLGARPIANTDVFCVATPWAWTEDGAKGSAAAQTTAAVTGIQPLPRGVLPPRRVLSQVVAGVRDYGNRMGIPTVNGAVAFDDRYIGNPLVFCGCIGLIPRGKVKGKARPGDRIVAIGGRTGRDGVHGATFSSAAIGDTSADEFSHAVQIGNAIEEKRVMDAILRARDEDPAGPLYHGMTDCGAGGFSSAIGEMGGELGAEVHLDRAPLKYAGLSYTEVWISEAQERMVLAVPPEKLQRLEQICDQESVEMADLGVFGTPNAELVLRYRGAEVGRMSMHLLHDGIPQPTRVAHWEPSAVLKEATTQSGTSPHPKDALLALLAHPNIASKHWIIRQYDHEVRGNTVVKPLVGPESRGPSDASVLAPVAGSDRGFAVACGLQTPIGDPALGGDPYEMALAGIDEAVRNLACVGVDPSRIAILDNFCWPSCAKPQNLAALVRACAGCYDGAKAYRTPFVSGKDSLNNQFTTDDGRVIEIPFTLLITGLGIVPDVGACVTSDAKRPGNVLMLLGDTSDAMGGSHYQSLFGSSGRGAETMPRTSLKQGPATARLVHQLIRQGLVQSAHDCSDGGLLIAIAEMLIGGSARGSPIGAGLGLSQVHSDWTVAAFAESPSRYVLETSPGDALQVFAAAAEAGVPCCQVAGLDDSGVITDTSAGLSLVVGDAAAAWRRTLDW